MKWRHRAGMIRADAQSYAANHCPAFVRILFITSALILWPADASAQTSATFDVRANITPGCAIDGFGTGGNAGQMATLDFGSTSALATTRRTASTETAQNIVLRCTPGVALSIRLDGGRQADAGMRRLKLGSSAHHLPYRICRDSLCSQPVAINVPFSRTITSGESQNISLALFADLTLPGNLPAGVFSDSVTITLSW